MSLLGPRPPLTYHPWSIEEYTEEQLHMFDVRPGFSGWAQVHGRKDVEWNHRIELNVWYINRVDLYSDAFGNPILFMTAALTGTLAVVLISMMTDNRILIELGKNSLIYYGLHRIIIDLMFVVYGKMGIQIDNTSWSAVGFAIISVCVAIMILTPVNCFVLKYMPCCLGKKKG